MKDNNKAPERLADPSLDASAQSSKAAKKEKAKKPNFFVRAGKRIARWFREMRSELKKVVWPTWKQTLNNAVIALVIMVCAGIVIGAFDYLASLFVKALNSFIS